jgi:hypothetical protein
MLLQRARLIEPVLLLERRDRLLGLAAHAAVISTFVEPRALQLLLNLLELVPR